MLLSQVIHIRPTVRIRFALGCNSRQVDCLTVPRWRIPSTRLVPRLTRHKSRRPLLPLTWAGGGPVCHGLVIQMKRCHARTLVAIGLRQRSGRNQGMYPPRPRHPRCLAIKSRMVLNNLIGGRATRGSTLLLAHRSGPHQARRGERHHAVLDDQPTC